MKNLPFVTLFVLVVSCDFSKSLSPGVNNLVVVNPSKNLEAIAGDFKFRMNCPQIPSILDVQNEALTVFEKFMSAEKALDLNIPIINSSASQNLTVYVKDYKRFKDCISDDEDVTNQYGYLFRSVIEISNFESSVESSLAAIAASGTLNSKRQSFYFYKMGFNHPDIDEIIGNVSGKVFNVENYSLFQEVTTKILQILSDSLTTYNVTKIGEINKSEDLYYDSPIRSYALTQIMKGKSCLDAKVKFENNNKATNIIESTYNFVTNKCSNESPSDLDKLNAKKYMNNLIVK